MAKGAWVMRTAVMVSILAHASLIGAAGLRRAARAPAEPPAAVDLLAGTTALPAFADDVHDVDVVGGSGAEAPPAAPPAPAAGQDVRDEAPVDPPPPKIAQDKPTPKQPPKTTAPSRPLPLVDKPEARDPKDDPQPKKTPDPAEDEQVKPVAQDEPAPDPNKKPSKIAKRSKPSSAAPATASSVEAGADAAANASSGGTFGVDGATSIRNLGRAFAHALPPACDSDKTWAALAVGSGGSLEVAVLVDEEGKVTGVEPITTNPPAHLVSAAKRTIANIRRSLAVLGVGSVNPGKHVLRMSAKLSDVTVTDEEASGAAAFGLSSEWEGQKGVASFTQPSGRHVEIVVEFVRVLPLEK